jgi:DNA-binding transcriptional LysR family regulator
MIPVPNPLYNPQLLTFLKVAEAGSFNKAAEDLHISPPALIKQINLLEAALDLRLFSRSHRGLELTTAGESLLQDARYLIQYCQDSVQRAQSARQKEQKVIRLGTSPMTPVDFLLDLWPKLQQVSADIQFHLIPYDNTIESAREILKNLGQNIDVVAGVFDEGMFHLHEYCTGLAIQKQPMEIYMPVNHPLTKKSNLTWKKLEGETLCVIQAGWSNQMDKLRAEITLRHPRVKMRDFPFFNLEIFNACVNQGWLLVGFPIWENSHPLLTSRTMDWDYAMDYGILYNPLPSEPVRYFLKALKKVLELPE